MHQNLYIPIFYLVENVYWNFHTFRRKLQNFVNYTIFKITFTKNHFIVHTWQSVLKRASCYCFQQVQSRIKQIFFTATCYSNVWVRRYITTQVVFGFTEREHGFAGKRWENAIVNAQRKNAAVRRHCCQLTLGRLSLPLLPTKLTSSIVGSNWASSGGAGRGIDAHFAITKMARPEITFVAQGRHRSCLG